MAEIKSTLDLVMERTKHLQLSESERREHQTRESKARLRGMVQKLQDGIYSEERFSEEYHQLKSDGHLVDDVGLISECTGRLSINGDNRAVLAALKSASGSVDTSVEAVIEVFRHRYHERFDRCEQRLSDRYAARYEISGTAFSPNPDRDPEWRRELADLEKAFRQELDEAVR
jgi:hypothetical protein